MQDMDAQALSEFLSLESAEQTLKLLPDQPPLPTSVAVNRAVDIRRSLAFWYGGKGQVEVWVYEALTFLRFLTKSAAEGVGSANGFGSMESARGFYELFNAMRDTINDEQPNRMDQSFEERIINRVLDATMDSLSDDEIISAAINLHNLIEDLTKNADTRCAHHVAALREARLIVADMDMCQILSSAAKSFPEDHVLREEDLPAPAGMVLFSIPFEISITIQGISSAARTIASKLDSTATDDSIASKLDSTTVPVTGLLWFSIGNELVIEVISKLDDAHEELNLRLTNRPNYMLGLLSAKVPFGKSMLDLADEDGLVASDRTLVSLLLMFTMLSQQPMTTVERGTVDKKVARKSRRSGMSGDVDILMLRPRSDDHHSDEGSEKRHVEWKSRWIVDAHWRRQWYPSIKAHRPKLILPYVKGPGDKPISTKNKIWVSKGEGLGKP